MHNSLAMWSEEYQPKTLGECVLDGFPTHVQNFLKKVDVSSSLPNLLLFGPAGTGKTTIANIICDKRKYNVQWINGSLMSKDDVAKLAATSKTRSLSNTMRRVILIDEAEGITLPAQYALRSLISPSSPISWIFTCNYRKRLIEPIASRFMQIECNLPPSSERERHITGIVRRCRQVLDAEAIVNVSDDQIFSIADMNYPDLRQTINELQLQFSLQIAAA